MDRRDFLKAAGEMNNVYDDPAYQDIIKQLNRELIRMRAKYEDEDGIVISL
jgi:hypothetical protein